MLQRFCFSHHSVCRYIRRVDNRSAVIIVAWHSLQLQFGVADGKILQTPAPSPSKRPSPIVWLLVSTLNPQPCPEHSMLHCKTQNPLESVSNQHIASVTKTFLKFGKRCACHLIGETREDEFLIPTICLFKQLLLDFVPWLVSNTHCGIFPVVRVLSTDV